MKQRLLASTAIVAGAGLAGAGFFAGQADAQGLDAQNFYAGAGASVVTFDGYADTEPGSSIVTGLDAGAKVFAGYQFHKYGAVEGTFHYFGRAEGSTDLSARFDGYGVSLSLLGIVPVNAGADVFLRAGFLYGWVEAEGESSTTTTDSGISAIVGLGANLHLTDQISVRLEGEYVPDIGQTDRDSGNFEGETTNATMDVFAFTVSFLYRF